jgi:serine/threonine protein kinase
MTQATPTTNPLLHGRYRIEEQLGAGRLAAVYRAYDERLQRRVLVHMLRKELLAQESLRQRFIQETHNSARRSHQSLLEIFDSGEIGGRPYMITEYVAGRTLRETGALTLEEALLYFRQVVGAVAMCQAAGVAHPPISSNNVILVEEGHVELVENWLLPAAEIGLDSACYRAPERSAGGPVTPASSVYALGLLLIEMLSGKRPISGDDPRAVAQAHLTAHIPTLAELRPLLYVPSLDRLLQQATARDPHQRPPDAAALGRALDELRHEIAGDTLRLAVPPVRPPSLRERINRTANEIAPPRPAPRREPAPAPVQVPVAPAPPARWGQPSPAQQSHPSTAQHRSIPGMAILLVLFVTVACAGYYGASLAMDALAGIKIPRPEIQLPSFADLGIELPEWMTGVVSGGGEVLVVTNVPEGEGLNLRPEPGLNNQPIGLLPLNTRVRKIEGPIEADNVPWLRVRARIGDQEVEGWVSGFFVKPE